MSFVLSLRCRGCHQDYEAIAASSCEYCFAPLEVAYDYDGIRETIAGEGLPATPGMWRYRHLLPTREPNPKDLGVGGTPLIRADGLASALRLRELWIKNDSLNPTGSFKDRVVSVAITKAIELSMTVLSCSSTGNLANSVAAHAARQGMPSVVFVPAGLEVAKLTATLVYGARLVVVDGTYDDVSRLCSQLVDELPSWGIVNNNLRSYYSEGSKTLGFEIAEQLDWRLPDHVIVPVGSGSQITKIHKGFVELHKVGLLAEPPAVAMHGAQASGCAPVASAFTGNAEFVQPVRDPVTIAKSIAIGNPADGDQVLALARSTGGSVNAVDDDQTREGIRLLARTEGMFTETAGGVAVAVLTKLVREGAINADDRAVILITGNGLKTIDAVNGDAGDVTSIRPQVEDLLAKIGPSGDLI
jgi:threonine synthase